MRVLIWTLVLLALVAMAHADSVRFVMALYSQGDCNAASLVSMNEQADARCEAGSTWQFGPVLNPDGGCRPDTKNPAFYARYTCTTTTTSTFATDIAQSASYLNGQLQTTTDPATGEIAARFWMATNVNFVNSLGYVTVYTITG